MCINWHHLNDKEKYCYLFEYTFNFYNLHNKQIIFFIWIHVNLYNLTIKQTKNSTFYLDTHQLLQFKQKQKNTFYLSIHFSNNTILQNPASFTLSK